LGRRRRLKRVSASGPDPRLVERLKREKISDVTFDGKTIRLKYDHHRLSRDVVVGEHILWVGSHSGDVVKVDDDLHLVEGLSVAVHETVEDYLEKRYGLSSLAEAHFIAEEVEARWARKYTQLKPGPYGRKVERVFRKEMAYKGLA